MDIDDFDMSEIAFDGATAYALEWDKDDTVPPLRIVRFSLLRPELREVMATLPKEAKEPILSFANGGSVLPVLRCASPWHIGSNGDVTVSAQLPWGDRTFEYATVTPQGVLFHDVSSLRMNDSSVSRVRLPDGSVVNYLDFPEPQLNHQPPENKREQIKSALLIFIPVPPQRARHYPTG